MESNSRFQLSRFSYSVVKELKLTKYKLNSTEKYVNLLESKKSLDPKASDNYFGEKKTLTHLLRRVTVYTMDSQINFDRQQVPDELIFDIQLVEFI